MCGAMLGWAKKAAQCAVLTLVCSSATWAGERPVNWSGNYTPCDRHQEILRRKGKDLGVRFSTSNQALALEFARALDFWATIVDMDWHEEDSRSCSIAIVDGHRDLFQPAEVARAQFPDRPVFQGWIAFNNEVSLPREELYVTAVHELGHVLGLRHNPSARSVMFYLRVDGPLVLDAADLSTLARRHKLRAADLDRPLMVSIPEHGRTRPRDRVNARYDTALSQQRRASRSDSPRGKAALR
jgi:hypothetical protein